MSTVVKEFYNSYGIKEVQRLYSTYCTFEYQNNLRLFKKYLPPSGKIIDIGAGPGQYSLPLLKWGYNVSLFDISDVLLEIARVEFEKQKVFPDEIYCEDARNIGILPDDMYDAILLMGPMYHVLENKDRKEILENVFKKLKKGGIAFVEYINAWGVMRVGIEEFPSEYSNVKNITRYLEPLSIDSQKECVEDFTDVYLSTPPESLKDLKNAGFEIISYAGTESFVSGMRSAIENVKNNDPLVFQNIVDAAFDVCEKHPYRDCTEHTTFIVKKKLI